MGRIEDIILSQDKRGVSALRPHLPDDYCLEAGRFALERRGTVLIATGFYIIGAGVPETDGPPGAVALANALARAGFRPVLVGDQYCTPVLRGLAPQFPVVTFPIADPDESARVARQVLQAHQPSLLVSVERCGATRDGRYLNMRGVDISNYTARLDYLFLDNPNTIGVGDGGNEIGMGKLAHVIPDVPSLPDDPAVTATAQLVIASVSNWGADGLATALSLLTGQDLLATEEEQADLISRCVELGCVDGYTGRREASVDSFGLEENAEVLRRLRQVLRDAGIATRE